MNDILKRYWKYVGGFILLAIIFSVIGVRKYQEDRKTLATEKANTAVLRAYLVDSTRTHMMNTINAGLDTVKAREAKKTEEAKNNAIYWENIANKRGASATKYRNKADSLAALDTGQCKEVITAFRQSNDELQLKNTALDSANTDLHAESEGYSRQLFICEKQSANKDSVIKSHEDHIFILSGQIENYQCYRDWGLKHRFWRWVFGWKCR